MLLGTLGTSLLGNILTGKVIYGAREGIVRAGYGNKEGLKVATKGHKIKMDF